MKKVSKRDTFALILLLVAGIGFLFYTYMYKPLLRDISAAKETLAEKESSKAYYSLMLSSDEIAKYEKEVADKLLTADEANTVLLPDLKRTKIIHFFDKVALSSGVTLNSIFFSEDGFFDTTPAADKTTGETYLIGELAGRIKGVSEEQSGEPVKESADAPVARQTFVDITFNAADYNQLTAFLRGVEAAKRSVYFDSMSIQKYYYTVETETGEVDENGDPVAESEQLWSINVTVRYSLIAIDKLSDTDAGFEEVIPAGNLGASDPFEG